MSDSLPQGQENTFSSPEDEIKIAEEIAGNKTLEDLGIDSGQFLDSIDVMKGRIDPFAVSGTSEVYEPETHEFDQGVVLDFASALYNSFVDAGEGIANLAPTIVQAAGGEDLEWAENWKKNVTDFLMLKRLYTVMLRIKTLMNLEILILLM